ncbi:MAG: class I SAM-dependent methyltransferase [Janthinobacterium lividum]
MSRLLHLILRGLIDRGVLTVRYPDGHEETYGGVKPGPAASIALLDARAVRGLVTSPGMMLGECYMDGTLVPVGCELFDFVDLIFLNMQTRLAFHPIIRWRERMRTQVRRLRQFNPAERSQRNVAHHYDLNGALYSLFLDEDRQYSCAYFERGDETLEEAQLAKKRHIAKKLLLRPGMEVLDIGCGWGGMAITLAREHGVRVTGITLSEEQLGVARARAEAAGLSGQVRFELADYRGLDRQFDRIVSVGMFEHVGVGHFGEFFDVVRRCLKDDGVALVHAIGRSSGPGSTNPWLAKYIFPGGYCPALSEVFAASEGAGLMTADCEVLRLHYAETLRHWRRRFAANRGAIAALYDERFCRMFEAYMSGSEAAFRRLGVFVWQMQLTREVDAVPLTRGYMADAPARVMQAAD